MGKVLKNRKGITLIALIITIIILLILAGVTITMITGDNGILKQATNARETNSKAEFEEQVKLAVIASRVNDTASIDLKTLDEELNKISGTTITKSADDNLPWIVKKGSYEVTITANGIITSNTTGKDDSKKDEDTKIDYGTKKPEEDTRTVIEQATAAKPTGSTINPNTNETTGIVMIDSNQNEWVWIEVPSTVFTSATSSTDYNNIKADLIEYAKDYREGKKGQGYNWTDEWYDGCGLTQEEYTTKYQTMLSSIYTNKGFYIGRYEAGIEGSDTNTNLARFSRIEITSSSPKAVSKRNMIPYNIVTCSDAQQLASKMSTGNKTSSLMYGIQWDLVCKFLEVKGNWDTSTNTAQYYIKSNSISWGNYNNSTFTINSTNAKKYNYSNKSCDDITGEKTSSMLLTTGASEYTNKMNIYDFAGNEFEWTLEHATTYTTHPCSVRGGFYDFSSSGFPASSRGGYYTTFSNYIVGLRPSLY